MACYSHTGLGTLILLLGCVAGTVQRKKILPRFGCTTDGSRYMKRIQAIDEHMHMELEQLDGTERCSLACA